MDWAMVWPAQRCRSPAVGTVGLVGGTRCTLVELIGVASAAATGEPAPP
jgi:hypothetical protein